MFDMGDLSRVRHASASPVSGLWPMTQAAELPGQFSMRTSARVKLPAGTAARWPEAIEYGLSPSAEPLLDVGERDHHRIALIQIPFVRVFASPLLRRFEKRRWTCVAFVDVTNHDRAGRAPG